MKRHPNRFTNSQWKEGSGPLFSSHNPATGELLWQGSRASPSDVEEAVQSANSRFEEWAKLPLSERAGYLENFSQILSSSKKKLAEAISKETGKPLWDAMSEVAGMINKVKISLEAYGTRCPTITREQPHASSITRHRPHGVVCVLGPFNFPAHLPNGHIVPALLAGNTVVFKPSELTPLVAEETMLLWEKAALPKGVINLVQGGRDTGEALLHHPGIQGLFFTGSYPVGKQLSEYLGSQPDKILALELGGNNPIVVGEITHLEAAAYMIVQSAYLTSGQRCTCARRLIIPNSEKGEALIFALIKMIGTITVGPYTQIPEPFMGPVISEKQVQKLLETQAVYKSKGGKPLVEMKRLTFGPCFISPGLMDVTSIPDRPDEEIFGPFLQVIRVDDFKKAIEEANRSKFGLSAGLLSQKREEYEIFYREIKAGVVNWNTPLTGASSEAPFGGIKCSGNHRPSAYYAADYCAYPVASIESEELKIPSNIPPGLKGS